MNSIGAAHLHITGTTRPYLVVGDPIRQIRSTELFNCQIADKGIDAVFNPLQAPFAEMSAAFSASRANTPKNSLHRT